MRTSGHPSLKSATRLAAITSSWIRASSRLVKMLRPACVPVNWPITCVRRGRKSGVFLSWRKAARSIFGPRTSRAQSVPLSQREKARQRFFDGGPSPIKHSALASLLYELANTPGEFRIVPSSCGDGPVGVYRQPFVLDSTHHLGRGLYLELLGLLSIVSRLYPRLPLRANLLDFERCGRKRLELGLTWLELLARKLL